MTPQEAYGAIQEAPDRTETPVWLKWQDRPRLVAVRHDSRSLDLTVDLVYLYQYPLDADVPNYNAMAGSEERWPV